MIRFGFTPCPNDAFAFHALVHGLVPAPFEVEPVLCDIEELNRRSADGDLELTKLSFGAAAAADDRYRLLRSGAALGHGVGPLVVARESMSLAEAAGGRIAVPGRETTAFLLLRLAAPALGEVVELRYDRILGAVVSGELDAGLIIHESRFTYGEHGLVAVADLGEWWEGETGLPVPLAGIFARSDLEPALAASAEAAIRASVEYAFAQSRRESRLRPLARAGALRRRLRRAHRALRQREQRRHRRRGARRDRAAARSRARPLPRLRRAWPGPSSSPPFARRSAATAARSRACGRTTSRRS